MGWFAFWFNLFYHHSCVFSFPEMTRKNDLIVWTFLSEIQQRIYKDFIHTPAVHEVFYFILLHET